MKRAIAAIVLAALAGAADAQMPPWRYGGPRNYGCELIFATEFNHAAASGNISSNPDGWSSKTVIPGEPDSAITAVTSKARRNYAIKFTVAGTSGGITAKSHYTKYVDTPYGEGQTINTKVWVYHPASQDLGDTFLIDWECETCFATSPGIRLYVNPNGYVGIERAKFTLASIYPPEGPLRFPIPADRWVLVEWEIALSTTTAGKNRVWVDGIKIIDQDGINLPSSALADVITPPFEYNKFQVGLTANGGSSPVYAYMDDVQVCERVYPRHDG